MSRLYRSVMDEMEYSGKSYEDVLADRESAAEAERDRRRDDDLINQMEGRRNELPTNV